MKFSLFVKSRWQYLAPSLVVVFIYIGALMTSMSDPLQRIEFSLSASDTHARFTVLAPRIGERYPLAILIRDSGKNNSYGRALQILASMGYATVAFDSDAESFSETFAAVLDYLYLQSWCGEKSIWIDFRPTRADLVEFAVTNRKFRPNLIVQVGGVWESAVKACANYADPKKPLVSQCNYVVISPDSGKVSGEIPQATQLAAEIGLPLKRCIVPENTNLRGEDHALVTKLIGEYGKKNLTPDSFPRFVAKSAHKSGLLWKTFFLILFSLSLFLAYRKMRKLGWFKPETRIPWGAALFFVLLAGTLTFIHTIFRDFPVNAFNLRIARTFLVAKGQREDFEELAKAPYWSGQPLRSLLTQTELANYTAFKLVNWKIEPDVYRKYVLAPLISDTKTPELAWREPLWKYFYPTVKKEDLPSSAAGIVVRYLREKVSIVEDAPSSNLLICWESGIANEATFNRLYVAALRSVAIPARLDADDSVEIWEDGIWMKAIKPLSLDCSR